MTSFPLTSRLCCVFFALAMMLPMSSQSLAAATSQRGDAERTIIRLEAKRTDRKRLDQCTAAELWQLHQAYLVSGEPRRANACAVAILIAWPKSAEFASAEQYLQQQAGLIETHVVAEQQGSLYAWHGARCYGWEDDWLISESDQSIYHRFRDPSTQQQVIAAVNEQRSKQPFFFHPDGHIQYVEAPEVIRSTTDLIHPHGVMSLHGGNDYLAFAPPTNALRQTTLLHLNRDGQVTQRVPLPYKHVLAAASAATEQLVSSDDRPDASDIQDLAILSDRQIWFGDISGNTHWTSGIVRRDVSSSALYISNDRIGLVRHGISDKRTEKTMFIEWSIHARNSGAIIYHDSITIDPYQHPANQQWYWPQVSMHVMTNGEIIISGYDAGIGFIERRSLISDKPAWRFEGADCGKWIKKARSSYRIGLSFDGQLYVRSHHGHHIYDLETGYKFQEIHRDAAHWLHKAAIGTRWRRNADNQLEPQIMVACSRRDHGVVMIFNDLSFIKELSCDPFIWGAKRRASPEYWDQQEDTHEENETAPAKPELDASNPFEEF